MKIEFFCNSCNSGYVVDAADEEAGVPCPSCGRSVEPTAAATAAAVDVAVAAIGAPVATAAPSRAASEVVCPRCNLHFKPRNDPATVAAAAADRATVLIVEDLAYFREIAAEALSDDYEVKGVATKAEALALLAAGGIDLLVLDLTLDGGDGGIDLLRELGTKPCPVLIYTAQDESEMYGDSWGELQRLGADDIVIKGMNVGDELVRKVGTLLEKS